MYYDCCSAVVSTTAYRDNPSRGRECKESAHPRVRHAWGGFPRFAFRTGVTRKNNRRGKKRIHERFRRVCRHAIGATDEGLLLAAADNNTFSRYRAAARVAYTHTHRWTNDAQTMAMMFLPTVAI